MRVDDVMTAPVVTVRDQATVAELLVLLTEKQISGVPVVDDRGTLTGIVSRHDIVIEELKAMNGKEDTRTRLAGILDAGYVTVAAEGLNCRSTRVRQIMTPASRIQSCRPSMPLPRACIIMVENRVHRLLVLAGRKLVGILTTTDVVRAVGNGTL
ncbi:MAG: CBS domain-containing protein [Acidobacteriota bacterium]